MRLAGTGLIVAAILALAGCKTADKSGDKSPTGLGAGRLKTKDANKDGRDTKGDLAKNTPPTWLENMDRLPGAGTGVPKSTGSTNPKDPNFDPRTAAQGALGGRVLDPNGKPAPNVYVRIEQLGVPANPFEIGVYTDNGGYFLSNSLLPGKSYEVTASAKLDGKPLSGSAQTKAPNATLLLLLRDDTLAPAGTFPPEPKPAEKGSDYIPPMGGTSAPAQPKPSGGAWGPAGPTTGVPPATIGGTGGTPPVKPPSVAPPSSVVPQPDDLVPSPKPVRPESTADGPKDFKPPVTNIPNPEGPPPVPKLPKLPPPINPVGGSGASMGTNGVRAIDKFTLLDPIERIWDSDSTDAGSLVLLEFMTASCQHCPKVIPILKDLQSRYGANGLQVMGVLCDDLPQKERAAAAGKYAQDYNLNYAVFIEPVKAGSVRDRLGVERYPTVVLLNSTGKVLWNGHPGETAKLEAAIKQGLSK